MFGWIKFYFGRYFSSRYILKGSCKKCGQCCRNIVFYITDDVVKTQSQFESLQRFNKSYSHFYISGQDDDGALLFTCKSLREDNSCADYFLRSIECRKYPRINSKFIVNGGKPLEGCGYHFGVNKSFEEYVKQ